MNVEEFTASDIHTTSGEETENVPCASIEETLKPLLKCMKIFGLYFDPVPSRNKVEPTKTATNPSTPGLWWSLNRVYCYLNLLLLWFNFGRCVVGLFPLDDGLSLRIMWTTLMLICAVNATVMIVACQKLTLLRSFYKHWNSLFQCPGTNKIGCGFKYPLTNVTLGTAFGWFVSVVNVSAFGAFLLSDLPQSQPYKTTLVRPFPASSVSMSFSVILVVFQAVAWIFPVIFVNIISRVIRTQFLQFRNSLSKQILKANDRIPDSFPQLRSHYTQLCQAVGIINVAFKWILGTDFLLNTFVTCFITYRMINEPLEFFSFACNVTWLIECFLNIVLLAISTSDVHNAAHSLLDDIFDIGTKEASVEQFGQLYLFVSKLTGTSIGFTALDFFVISKEFLLTLGGLFITYFFLLLQFKI